MKRILIIWPIGTPVLISDFWRCTLIYEVAAHIRKQGFIVDCFDGCEHKVFSDLFKMILSIHYDAFIINAPLDTMDGFIKTLKYLRIIDATKPIYVYGLSTILSPNTFKKLDIQGFSNSGFFEKGILSFLGKTEKKVNCVLKQEEVWKDYPREKGTPNDWSFMDITEALKFPVIGMSISRGCQGRCNFCSHAILHGNIDIRKPINDVCEYLEKLEKSGYSGKIEFASPTFTINKNWVKDYCTEYKRRDLNIKWRCVTRVDQIDSTIIKIMAEANCVRIGLGIETMTTKEQIALNKEIQRDRIFQAIKIIQDNNIEVLTYLISGVEKQTKENLIHTINTLKKLGSTIRVTALLRYKLLQFDDLIDTSIESDMYTSSLNKVDGTNNYDLLKLTLGLGNLI